MTTLEREIREALKDAQLVDDMVRSLIDTIARSVIKAKEEKIRRMINLNEWVRDARKTLGLTMKQVAEDLNVSVAAVSRYENGSRKIPVSYVRYWITKGIKLKWEDINEDSRHS